MRARPPPRPPPRPLSLSSRPPPPVPQKTKFSPPLPPQKAKFSPPLRPLGGSIARRPTKSQQRSHPTGEVRRRGSNDTMEEVILPTSTSYVSLSQTSNYASDDSNEMTDEPLLWNSSAQSNSGDVRSALKEAAVLLPKQAILENFVHRNPWEMLQKMDFEDAISHVERVLSAMSPMEQCFKLTGTDPRTLANPALAELCSVYLDRGLAKWSAPNRGRGFLFFFASLEGLGHGKWRQHARDSACTILKQLESVSGEVACERLAEATLKANLCAFGAEAADWTSVIRSMMFDMPGWSGMFQLVHTCLVSIFGCQRMEENPDEAPKNVNVTLLEFCAVQSILSVSAIQHLAAPSPSYYPPNSPALVCPETSLLRCSTPLAEFLSRAPKLRTCAHMSQQHPSGLAYVNQKLEMHQALEREFEQTTLTALLGCHDTANRMQRSSHVARPELQFFTCIDDRECSIRRHLEEASMFKLGEVETVGVAGFFNLPFLYNTIFDGCEPATLAPAGNKPRWHLQDVAHHEECDAALHFDKRRQLLAKIELYLEKASYSPIWSLLVALLLPFTFLLLIFTCLLPQQKHQLSQKFLHKVAPPPRTDFKLPFTPEEAASRLAATFKNIGFKDRFAQLVVVLGHGSRSVNNPFAAAYNCGACGGREGGPNARLMCRYANDQQVRVLLANDYGIQIPQDTWFIGGFHDTCSDLVELSDTQCVPAFLLPKFEQAKAVLYEARGKNALERCSKFLLAEHVKTPEEALAHVQTRSKDIGEPRPELNHATNACVVIGRRALSEGVFMARRTFLPSYDPWSDDDRGTNLELVITPALIVASGVSLEYFFSTVEGGAGTKVTMNVVGHLGVMQGMAGDLLVGLPTQTTEMHTPCRSLFLVEAPVSRLQAVFGRCEGLRHLVENNWVKLLVLDPQSGILYRQHKGEYSVVEQSSFAQGAAKPQSFVPTTEHNAYGRTCVQHELRFTILAFICMVLSCLVPLSTTHALSARGPIIAVAATALALCILGYSRRYLHGEFMYGRLVLLFCCMLVGFNYVALAPSMLHITLGWTIMGFSSAFLIGAYNDRPTARENATFVFAVNQASDGCMLVAAAFSHSGKSEYTNLVAAALLMAALIKTSQFPLVSLFGRSMEGASPSSALAYAALTAHVGIVLLVVTKDYWYPLTWARMLLALVGSMTSINAWLIANLRADRKSGLGTATAATVGMLYVMLSLGYTDTTLVLALGHATFRVLQILRAPNIIQERHDMKSRLGPAPVCPASTPEWLFRVAWRLHRFDVEIQLPSMLHRLRHVFISKPFLNKPLLKYQQLLLTTLLTGLAMMPYLPPLEETVLDLIFKTPCYLGFVALPLLVIFPTCLISIVMSNVLDPTRFSHSPVGRSTKKDPPSPLAFDSHHDVASPQPVRKQAGGRGARRGSISDMC